MKKKIAILGSTGSIGQQALEVVREFPEKFAVVALAAGKNLELLVAQAIEFRPLYVAIGQESLYLELKERLAPLGIEVGAGSSGLVEAAIQAEAEVVLTAVVGSLGIRPTLAAIEAGKQIALANKETLVAAGSVIIPAAQKAGVRIIPVDSEHSAIFQCLAGYSPAEIAKLVLTASGGPFRNYQVAQLEQVTLAQALQHPNWQMGGKITIDSATMFNKGLEIIEAHWLFGMDFDQIVPVIHPESIIHSLVEFQDGSHLAQLGLCDMRLPIQYALTYPARFANNFPKLDLTQGAQLNFYPVDHQLFPAVALAYAAGRAGGSLPAAMNAANEIAVAAFLMERIKFTEITSMVDVVMGEHQKEAFVAAPTLEELTAVDEWARQRASRLVFNKGEGLSV